jgi:hypothetical protein
VIRGPVWYKRALYIKSTGCKFARHRGYPLRRRAFLTLALGLVPLAAARAIGREHSPEIPMSYFTPAEHAALIANPDYISTLWANNAARFIADLGAYFAAEIDENRKLGFCALVAYDLKPYGQATALDLQDLLQESALDCDNYCALTWKLFDILVPSPSITVMVIGVDHGPVGNHAFMATHKTPDQSGGGGGYWVVDPTVGVMLCGHGIDWVLSGKACNMLYAKSFYWRSDIDDFHSAVLLAMQGGLHRPSHILYFTRDQEKFLSPPATSDWLTPASEGPIQ